MNESDDEGTNSTLEYVEISDTVREIFDSIFDAPMDKFTKPLKVIKDNQFGLLWREEDEREEKVRFSARAFLYDITTNLSSKHAEAAKHIEGSTCDLFLQYANKKLDDSLLGQEPFKNSCKEIKQLIKKKTSQIKAALEDHDDQPVQKSNLDVMISETDLLDPIHIRHALLCCKAANEYKDSESWENSLKDLEENGERHLLSDLCVSYESDKVPKYVMARCGNVLYVSFKGVQTHFGGISEAAQKIPLKYFAREIMQNKRIVFSGHSSGGAVAALVLVYLLEKFKNQEEIYLKSHFKCITFGLIALADIMLKHFIKAMPGAQDCFCHIVQKNDIIPKLFGSFSMTSLESKLWELVQNILQDPAFTKINGILQSIIQLATKDTNILNSIAGFNPLDIIGMYFILDTDTLEQKYLVLPAEHAATLLRIDDAESLRNIQPQYLINHKLERYAHEVELIFTRELSSLKNFKSIPNMAVTNDITPKITGVLFVSIGDEIVAKICGSSMWFVHHVSIKDERSGDVKFLDVDVLKSTGREVQAGIQRAKLCFGEKVSVRVKTHFHNPNYLKSTTVSAEENTYRVTRRQQQLAKHSPRAVMELAYLSALLERRQEGHHSNRFEAIKKFFESAVSVVPLESLFHAMANAKLDVMVQCCNIFCSCDTLSKIDFSSQWLLTLMERALSRIALVQRCLTPPFRDEWPLASFLDISTEMERQVDSEFQFLQTTKREEYSKLFDNTIFLIRPLLNKYKEGTKRLYQDSRCKTDLGAIYPSADVKGPQKPNEKRCKTPLDLLTEGRQKLNQLSEELITEHSGYTADETAISNTNIKMLSVLNDLRKEFETYSSLLGAFMESQVHIPLEKAEGDKFVTKFAKFSRSIGLSVWGLLILPIHFLERLTSRLSEDFRQFVVEFSSHIRGVRNYMFPPSEHQFPDYDERLEFLVGSMKQSWAINQQYVSYSLERQLRMECNYRNIHHNTPVDEILKQWNANFEGETLTLIPKEYRCLVARWIRWSLMINRLRESLANQTAVGVIGLVNSGKSKFVRSLFGKETTTGTTEQKRTTVPLIYNMSKDIGGLDVIDFPGVDDRDGSISELAELLLSLTRIIIFVVDYRRAHTKSTKEWLDILEKENVPVLICLTFADKLFAELMGEYGDYGEERVKLAVQEQLDKVKKTIGQAQSGHQREFKFVVFAFDNDSILNTEEGKEKLRKAGLSDELDVGRWIAEKFLDDEQDEVSENLTRFIEKKEKSTLNSNKCTSVPLSSAKEKIGKALAAKRKHFGKERASDGEQPTCSKKLYNLY